MNKYLTLFLFLFISSFVGAQSLMTVEDAIATALKNNFSIAIARNDSLIATNNHSLGNAGFLPSVDAGAGYSLAGNNTKQEYSTGQEVNKTGASSDNLTYGVALNWTLFDGLRMFVTYDKLNAISLQGSLALKQQMEQVIDSTMSVYYAVVEQQQALKVAQEILMVAQQREKIATDRLNIGSGSGVEYNQAKVELNNAKVMELQQANALAEAKIRLNQLLNFPPENGFTVSDSIIITYSQTVDDLKKTVPAQNLSLLYQQGNESIATYNLRELRADRFPRINFSTGYNFSRSSNNASFILFNQNLGWNAGITASINLFNGFNLNRNIQNAKISLLSAGLQVKQVQQRVSTSLLIVYGRFNTSKEILALQEESYKLAKSNLDVALEKYRIGSINSLELAFEQQTFTESGNQVVSARYNTKLLEISLMRLNGELVK